MEQKIAATLDFDVEPMKQKLDELESQLDRILDKLAKVQKMKEIV